MNTLGTKLVASTAALLLLIAAPAAFALPNLTPYQPSGWSDKIVVSKLTGTTTDSSPLYTTDTLYVDWAVVNNGNAAAGSFYVYIYVDGAYKTFWNVGSLNANTYQPVNDYSIGSLSAGNHTITITADATGAITESNEGDNSYTKTITISTPSLPNLTPYQPSGWSDKIVVSKVTGTTTDSSPLYTTDTLYVDWAVVNNGTAAAGSFYVYIYVDGAYKTFWNVGSLNANTYQPVNDYSIGSLSAGNHTITITADATGAITESNEGDNSYTKTITVSTPSLPNLTPYQPSGWSDKIVVSKVTGTTTDSSPLYTTDTLYVDWAVVNNGTAAAGSFYVYIYVDGAYKTFWNIGSLNANTYQPVNDYSIGSLSAGNHTITITADATGAITESNEGDNSYTKTITVSTPSLPNLTPYEPPGWSDEIVVCRTATSTTDSTSLTTADTLYVNAAVVNNGTAATAVNFNNELYVDGVATYNWVTLAPLNVNYYSSLTTGYPIGQLSAGTHTIKITADYGGVIAESNESDNSYTKTITVIPANLPSPTLSTPANGSTGQSTTPSFTWSQVPGATSYRIIVATSAADLPADPTSGTGGPSVVINDTTTNTTYAPSTALSSGTAYHWEVHGRSATQFGVWSTAFSFTTAVPAPVIRIQPTDLAFSCSEGSASPSSLVTAGSPPKPAWDGVLRGVSASPFPFKEKQPDGTQITLFIRGGVNLHWLEDTNGFTVLENNGSYIYAQIGTNGLLVPTPLMVGKDDPRSIGLLPRTLPKALPAAQQATSTTARPSGGVTPTPLIAPIGNVKNVVILMRFANHTSRALPTVANFTTILNAVGGNPTIAPSGSVHDVYYENSYGTMTLNSTVFAWVTLPHTEAYYADGVSGLGSKFKEAITDALNLADPLVDFSQFDDDHDGFVDTITFIHSGYGAKGGTDPDSATAANRIWSHRSAIATWTSAEGVKVSGYVAVTAFWGISGAQPTHIGVICHELGHFFGLPNLYDTDGSSSGIGAWCMMADEWGFANDQLNPPHFSAWAKVFLGWVIPTVITAPGTYTAPQSESSPTVFRINNGYPTGEYLLVENRQPYGFDKNIPQGGLAVWHIDENKAAVGNTTEGFPGQIGWPANNNHYQVALLQADGNYDLEHDVNHGDSGDLYRSGGVTQISHTTVPNSDAYENGNIIETDNRLYTVSASGPTMTFNFSTTPSGNSFVIYNDGTATLTVSSIALDQSAPWISWSGPSTPFNIAPGRSQTITVSADCAQAPSGQTTRRIFVYSNDPAHSPYPGGVNVTVTAPAPAISVTPASQEFGSIQVGTTADRSFAMQNTGGGTLSGSASVSSPFSIVSGSPYSLTANQSTSVTVRYSPTSAGTDGQNVSFTGGGGATRQVSGSAYASPAISVTPASQDFGSIVVGSTADRSFGVQNIGGGTLSGSASVSAPFSIVAGSPYSLTANQATSVTVRYSPGAAGSDDQNVSFTGGAGASRPVSGSAFLPSVDTPAITPPGGTFQGSVQVTLTETTSGADIRYTLDGNDPTTESTLYGGPFILTASSLVKAKGFESGYNASAVGQASFSIEPLPPPQLAGISLASGGIDFAVTSVAGATCVIQTSDDLKNWLPLSTNTIPLNGTLQFSDPDLGSQTRRFLSRGGTIRPRGGGSLQFRYSPGKRQA